MVEGGGKRSLMALAKEVNWEDMVDKLRVVSIEGDMAGRTPLNG